MQEPVLQKLIEKALQYVGPYGHIQFAFQGGEPTLAGLSYFELFVAEVNRRKQGQKIDYVLQTNGLLLDEKWAVFLKQHAFLLGVSLDGFKSNTDTFRYDTKKKGVYDRVMQAIAILRKYDVPFNILTVLTSELSRHPKQLYDFYKEHDFEYVQLIPCLDSLDETKVSSFELKPQEFANFYKIFYKLWAADYKIGKHMSVTLFDNVIPMFNGVPPQQCGMLGFCSPQLVVEANGSIYPCDFYVLDENECGNIMVDELSEILQSRPMKQFLAEPKKMSKLCETCQFKTICNGGCKRQNGAYFRDDFYCGYQDFLYDAHESMNEIAKMIRN